MIGFASGIYFSKFHQSILGFAEKNLPDDKKVFLICTYGGSANYKSIEQILDKKRSKVIGKFGCKGYDTFGPFKLVGGIAKGHPDEEDIKNAVEFVRGEERENTHETKNRNQHAALQSDDGTRLPGEFM